MMLSLWPLILLSLLSFVGGQLLLKFALGDQNVGPFARRALVFTGGIAGMTISFFVNLWLLRRLPLSFLFPLSRIERHHRPRWARACFSKNRLTVPLVVGAILVTAGVMLVSAS